MGRFTERLLKLVAEVARQMPEHSTRPEHRFPRLAGSHLTQVRGGGGGQGASRCSCILNLSFLCLCGVPVCFFDDMLPLTTPCCWGCPRGISHHTLPALVEGSPTLPHTPPFNARIF